MNDGNLVCFLLTFFLGFIGSFIINHFGLRHEGYMSRTMGYFFWSLITLGLYNIVASICNLTFDPNKEKNIGWIKM